MDVVAAMAYWQPQKAILNQSVQCCIYTILIGIMQLQTAGNVAVILGQVASCQLHVAGCWLLVASCQLPVAGCQCSVSKSCGANYVRTCQDLGHFAAKRGGVPKRATKRQCHVAK